MSDRARRSGFVVAILAVAGLMALCCLLHLLK